VTCKIVVNVYICMYMLIHVYEYVSIVYMLCSPTLEEIKNLSISMIEFLIGFVLIYDRAAYTRKHFNRL